MDDGERERLALEAMDKALKLDGHLDLRLQAATVFVTLEILAELRSIGITLDHVNKNLHRLRDAGR